MNKFKIEVKGAWDLGQAVCLCAQSETTLNTSIEAKNFKLVFDNSDKFNNAIVKLTLNDVKIVDVEVK